MKTIVIYKSLSGFTRKYAEWIAEELKADLCSYKQVRINQLIGYDLIIYGGSLHSSGVNGIKLIKKNLEKLKSKKLIIFTTGASPSKENVHAEICNHNFTTEEQKYIRFYYFRGGFDYQKLDPFNKIIMIMFKKMLQGKKNKTPDIEGMLAAYENPTDFTNKDNIKDLIQYARSLSQ